MLTLRWKIPNDHCRHTEGHQMTNSHCSCVSHAGPTSDSAMRLANRFYCNNWLRPGANTDTDASDIISKTKAPLCCSFGCSSGEITNRRDTSHAASSLQNREGHRHLAFLVNLKWNFGGASTCNYVPRENWIMAAFWNWSRESVNTSNQKGNV